MPDFNPADIDKYWLDLNLQKPMVDRLNFLLGEAKNVIQPDLLFLENAVGADGNLQYPNLALFTGRGWADFAVPIQTNNTFVMQDATKINAIIIVVREEFRLDGTVANEKSRLRINMTLGSNLVGTLQAAGAVNCLALLDLMKRYFVPKLA